MVHSVAEIMKGVGGGEWGGGVGEVWREGEAVWERRRVCVGEERKAGERGRRRGGGRGSGEEERGHSRRRAKEG